MISRRAVVDFIDSYALYIKEYEPSFFEMTTLLAFDHFAHEGVDIAIIETGLGGRLDSTNIVRPLLSIVTNIGLDHTQYLGTTLEAIAAEKAGIIKAGVPVVVGAGCKATEVFRRKASDVAAHCLLCDSLPSPVRSMTPTAQGWSVETVNHTQLTLPLAGDYQRQNLCTTLVALSLLDDMMPALSLESSIVAGLEHVIRNTGLRGRWETLSVAPHVVCDVGHNVDGMLSVGRQLEAQPCDRLHIILGMMHDKDVEEVIRLLPSAASYYYTNAPIPRALSADQLAQIGNAALRHGAPYPSVDHAFEAAMLHYRAGDMIFVGGSFHIVAEAMRYCAELTHCANLECGIAP